MYKVAIIPARGGSKRIPRKNIKAFLGRPMISYPIRCLQKSGLVDSVIVSTDDEEIAEVAKKEGAEVPFMRPAELADDHTGTGAVTLHAIEWLKAQEKMPEFVCCVYATTPLLDARYLREGFEKLIASDRQFAFSVTSFPFPIQRALKMTGSGGVMPFYPEYIPMRSQDLEPSYHDAGQFYWGRTEAFLGGYTMFSDDAIPIVLPRYLVQDIDDNEDWQRAELMYRAIHD
jgi:N-acylneuraminate cytidylyltransferase